MDAMKPVLHYHPTSPYSRKVAVGTALRGDDLELRWVDVTAGVHRSTAFLARSPFGKLPVLDLGDRVLYESTSILEHLEAQGPPRLLPPRHALAARHWDRVGDLYLLEPQSVLFFGGDEDAARTTIGVALHLLAGELADGRRFLCGDEVTLADLSTAIGCDQVSLLGEALPAQVTAWLERMRALPAMATHREAGMPLTLGLLARRRARLGSA
jgi:glutathione S-transferase